jgi:hypothetical protein
MKEATETEKPTLKELINEIRAGLDEINGVVSADRAHSVESHLRVTIRQLGYRPTETLEKRATIPELADQLDRVLYSLEDVPEQDQDLIHQHLSSIASNVAAECGLKEVPQLKEIPARKTE